MKVSGKSANLRQTLNKIDNIENKRGVPYINDSEHRPSGRADLSFFVS